MKKVLSFLALAIAFAPGMTLKAQVMQMSDFVMFAGNGGPGTTNPGGSGYGIFFGQSGVVNYGAIGSYASVQTTGNAVISSDIVSAGTVILANGTTSSGRISAANTGGLSGNILSAGNVTLTGRIDVNGDINVQNGVVSGPVYTSGTYTGPPVAGGVNSGPSFPTLPASLPTPNVFPAAGTLNITGNRTITPGAYGNVAMSNNKTLTLNGPGVYVFNSINQSGNNNIVFNFQNSANGVFRIYVHGDINLQKPNMSMINGGSETRIYWETHGTGSSSPTGKDAFLIMNGSNGGNGAFKHMGSVYAPYAAISIGSGTGTNNFTGTLVSGTQIIIQSGVTLTYSFFTDCSTVPANAGPDAAFCPGGSASLGVAPEAGNTYSWSPTTGLSDGAIANPTVTLSTPGSTVYTLTRSYNGCSSTDQVSVTVYSLPVVSAGSYSALCSGGSAITLSGTPSGGTFSGTGVSGNSFDPATAGIGTHTITYSYTDAHGCSNSATTDITVNATPTVNAGSYGPVCSNSSSVTLSGSPAGGTFSGTGVSGSTFSPATAGVGTHTITYSYTDGSGCSNSATTDITVNSLPNASAGNADSLDCFTPTVNLAGSSTTPGALYNWVASGGGHIVGASNLANATVDAQGIFNLTVTDPLTGCTATDADTVGFIDCIFSLIDEDGKSDEIIGIDLTSLYLHYDGQNNPNSDFFIINSDSVWVEIVYYEGMYNTLVPYLLNAPFNLDSAYWVDNGTDNRIITTEILISDLWALNNLNISTGIEMINHVRPVYPAIPTAGPAYSYGDIAQKSSDSRGGFNINGTGTKIGVISDSYNTIPGNYANVIDVPTDELPGVTNPSGHLTPVQIIQEYPYGVRSDEGRAMLQIVHDVAPGAELAFASGIISQGNMAQQIRNMKLAGCDAAVDDVTYPTAPFFQDGLVSRAIREVTGQGMTYVTSAGNFGAKSCEGTFHGTTVPSGNNLTGEANDFGAGDVYQQITLDSGVYLGVLQWQDNFYSTDPNANGAISDLDWYLTYNNGLTLFGMNRDNNGTVQNLAGGDAFEVLSFYVNIPANATVTANILIIRDSADSYPTDTRWKYVFFKAPANAPVINEYSEGNTTIVGHANCDSAITVGAVRYQNTLAYGVEPFKTSYSSVGGTSCNGVPVSKPDLMAPTGVNTTVDFGGVNEDNPYVTLPAHDIYPNFHGTSASAPHVAGIVALALEAKMKYYGESLEPYQVKNLLTGSAYDMYSSTMPGFDYLSGYGFADADSAMRTFAAPTPDLIDLGTLPSGYSLGDTVPTFWITVTADYITTQSVIMFRDSALTTTWVDAHHLSAQVPEFFGNPPFYIYSPPITPDSLDGGFSDSLYFFTYVKREVVIQADDKTKKYGENVPEFTSTVTVDGLSLADAGLTLADLGLENNIQYSTLPTTIDFLSITGTYAINPEPIVPLSGGLLELYNYTFNNSFQLPPGNGSLVIEKMPLTITPDDKTVLFGDKIDGREITYTYTYDETNIDPANRQAFLDSLKAIYEPGIVKEVVLIDDRDEFDGGTLSSAELNNLAFLSGSRAIANGSRAIANGSRAIANNLPYPDTSYVVDLSYESVVNYNNDGSNAELVDSITLMNGSRAIANGSRAIANSLNVTDGSGLINGSRAIANGSRAIANGSRGIVNSEELDGVSNTNTAVVLHATDTLTEENPDSTFQMISINAITGLTSGTHWIIPGGFMSSNFSVTYGLGTLQIDPYEIVITAGDTSTEYGTAPAYSIDISGYQYDDTAPVVFLGSPTFSPDASSQINVGSHTINVSGLSLIPPSNYTLTYQSGTLNVTPATLTATADDQSRAFGAPDPAFTISYSGFKFSDDASVISPAITATTTATVASPPGTYPINLSGGAAANYNLVLVTGTLTITQPAYCAYTQEFWGDITALDCYGSTSEAILPPLLSSTLMMGDGTRVMSFDVGDANCMQTKLPSGHTNGQLPNGNVNCYNATGNGYLNSGKFRSNLLGQNIALALAVRISPMLGTTHITGQYITTWASSNCVNGTMVPGTRQVYQLPSSVVNYLGTDNTVNDLIALANKGLGATLPGGAPNLNSIADALYTMVTAFDHCRILAGFSNTSAGARAIAPTTDDFNGIYMNVYPNPATSSATVSFVASEGSRAVMEIYALNGAKMTTVLDATIMQDGIHAVDVDCSKLSAGIYIVRLSVDEETSIQKLVILD